jgi:hypothetical protein
LISVIFSAQKLQTLRLGRRSFFTARFFDVDAMDKDLLHVGG